jgi:excisionase family DNA binding protein
MNSTVLIIDEQKFEKLLRKIDTLSEEVKTLTAKDNGGLKERWLVTDEVCKILNVSKRKLQLMRTNKEIKFKKSGKKIYYKASDVEAYIDNLNQAGNE